MKITRHTAKDMRQALKLVRDQLGPEAVILTSKRTATGVEVTAAIDFDAARLEAQAAAASAAAEPRVFQPEQFAQRDEDEEYSRAERDVQESTFARIQVELEREPGGASAAAARNRQTGSAAHGRNRNVPAAAQQANTRTVPETSRGARSEERPPQRAVQNARRSSQQDVDYDVGRNMRFPDDNSDDVGDDVHAALETAIDSYMTGGSVAKNTALAGAIPPTRAMAQLAQSSLTTQSPQSTQTARASQRASAPAEPTALEQATFEQAILEGNVSLGASTDTDDTGMGAELKAMRRILETQMAQLAWNDLTRRAPIHTEILRELTEVGLTHDVAARIVAQLPAGTDIIKARRLSISLLATSLQVTGDRWLDKGGRIALVGPTGVGKTTALAKLAVRWVLRHGARSLALISADGIRIGAHDQMQSLGQLLDVPVYIAESFNDIPNLLAELGSQRLVLIDTPGMSQRDPNLEARMKQLADAGHQLETALVLSASTQAGAIEETVKRFAPARASSALLTKVDEAASLGGVLSAMARSEMPISYVSEGQRVPEDLRPARSLELVSSAVQLAKTSGAVADEDLLRRRYGEVAHALA
jgi:flagellar biosynthesis protein FlhF